MLICCIKNEGENKFGFIVIKNLIFFVFWFNIIDSIIGLGLLELIVINMELILDFFVCWYRVSWVFEFRIFDGIL